MQFEIGYPDTLVMLSRKTYANLRVACSAGLLALVAAGAGAGVGVQHPASAESSRSWGALQFIGPDTIADVTTSVAPSVVNINALASAGGGTRYLRRDDGNKRTKRYLGIDVPPSDLADNLKITGSGVLVRPDGYILTSLHVVENANKVGVTLQDGRTFDGTIVARDRFTDLALVKIDAQNLPTVKWGNPESLRLGDWVIAIGNQFGLGHTVTHGLVSGLGREAKAFDKSFGAKTGAVRFIQTDAPINPGSSGGPLLNLKGEVVGLNTFIRDDAQNIGFAIPANVARDTAEKLTSGASIAHPYIGIVMRDPAERIGKEASTEGGGSAGVEVVEVKLRSPASQAGIVPGDVITEVDSSPVAKSDDVSLAVSKHKIGETMKVVIRRGAESKMIPVVVERLPESD